MAGGRPTKYTPELANRICEIVATTGEGIRTICKMHDDFPNPDTLYAWRDKYPAFSERFLNARVKQSHILFETSLDDIKEIKDYYYADGKTGATCVDSGIVAAQKAIAQHKIGMAAKIQPKIYGDKQIIEQTTSENESLKSELIELRAKLAENAKSEY